MRKFVESSERGKKDGSQCNDDRRVTWFGNPDVLECSPQTPLHAPYPSFSVFLLLSANSSISFFIHLLVRVFGCRSVGARRGNGVGRCFCEPASQMGGPGRTGPRQDAWKGQSRQRKTLHRFSFLSFLTFFQLPIPKPQLQFILSFPPIYSNCENILAFGAVGKWNCLGLAFAMVVVHFLDVLVKKRANVCIWDHYLNWIMSPFCPFWDWIGSFSSECFEEDVTDSFALKLIQCEKFRLEERITWTVNTGMKIIW